MPEWRLRHVEKEFLQQIMDRAVHHVQMRDTQKCCEYALRAILADRKTLKLAKATLRTLVLDRLQCAGHVFFKSLFKRHAPFLALSLAYDSEVSLSLSPMIHSLVISMSL